MIRCSFIGHRERFRIENTFAEIKYIKKKQVLKPASFIVMMLIQIV